MSAWVVVCRVVSCCVLRCGVRCVCGGGVVMVVGTCLRRVAFSCLFGRRQSEGVANRVF